MWWREHKVFISIATVLTIIVAVICGIIVKERSDLYNEYASKPVIDSATDFLEATQSERKEYIVLNAPLSSSGVTDEKGILTRAFDIPPQDIVFVTYQEQECYEQIDDDDGVTYHWRAIGEPIGYVAETVKVYDAYELFAVTPQEFSNMSYQLYYPNGNKRQHEGQRRFGVRYLTTSDRVTFEARVGNGNFNAIPMRTGEFYVVNKGIDGMVDRTSPNVIFIIVGFVYFILLFLAYIVGESVSR